MIICNVHSLLLCRDRVAFVWQAVRDHLYHLCVNAVEFCFLVDRAVVGLLRLAIRLLRREEISAQVKAAAVLCVSFHGVAVVLFVARAQTKQPH